MCHVWQGSHNASDLIKHQTWILFLILVRRLLERFRPCLGTPYNSSSSVVVVGFLVVVVLLVVVVFLVVVIFLGLTGSVTLGG